MFTTDTNAYYSVIEKIDCKTIVSTLHNVDSYVYFGVDDERVYNTNQNLYMLVEYYDSYKDAGPSRTHWIHSWRVVSYELTSDSFKDLRDRTMWKRNGGLPYR